MYKCIDDILCRVIFIDFLVPLYAFTTNFNPFKMEYFLVHENN